MRKVDLKKTFQKYFPWHYDPLKENTNDCPALGNLDLEYNSIVDFVLGLCEKQNPKNNGRGWSYYFKNGRVRHDVISKRPESFQKMFDTWLKTGWNHDNSCFYEFHDNELGEYYPVIMEAYEKMFGKLKNKQLRVFVKPPMTALGLHCDTYNSYARKHGVEQKQIFRAFTVMEDWQWGHYNLIGNEVLHQYRAGECYQINPNIFHLSGNMGFNPMITMNLTGVRHE